jgi:hypothetical protein
MLHCAVVATNGTIVALLGVVVLPLVCFRVARKKRASMVCGMGDGK